MTGLRRRTLSRTIAILIALDILAIVAVASVTAYVSRQPLVIAIVTASVAFPLAFFTLRIPLRRLGVNLAALADGVRGFADGDFSLRLRVTGDDEISDLVALYNEIGGVLRAQRSDSLQRALLFETVLQTSPLAIVLTSDDGRVVYANRAARELLTPGQRLEGRRLDDLLAASPALREAFASARDAIFSADGETYHLARRTFFLNGHLHVLSVANRLTPELRRQEVEVWKRAIRMLNHELNNSLAPIRSLFHSARAIRDRPEQLHRLDEINEAVEERLDYLQRFLDSYARFARLPKPRRARERWSEVLTSLQRITPFRVAELPDHDGSIDRTQIEQVIINLVKNAADAGSPADEIVVGVERRAGGSQLTVSDRGQGMDDDAFAHALLPFWSTRSGGSGLGLPLCNEIIDAHGGRLRIARREGGGTVVSCWVPDV
jgi:nitrogen fixation/metabolism regulation signal transduction histidine kinase